jgi:hypothetical protein
LGPEEIGILLCPRVRPRNESGPVGEGAPGENAYSPPADAGIKGRPRFLMTRFRRTHRLVRSSPAGLSPGRWNWVTSKECLFYFGLLCIFRLLAGAGGQPTGACQNEASVSPWPRSALALQRGGESFGDVITGPCPKGPRFSAGAREWMRWAAFPAGFWRRPPFRPPGSTSDFSMLFLGHNTSTVASRRCGSTYTPPVGLREALMAKSSCGISNFGFGI